MGKVDDAALSADLVDNLLEWKPRRDPRREKESNDIGAAPRRDLLADDYTFRIEIARPERAVERVMIGDGNAIELHVARAFDELARCLVTVMREAGVGVEVSPDTGLFYDMRLGVGVGILALSFRVNVAQGDQISACKYCRRRRSGRRSIA